jgi:hypothetical protein
VILKPTLQVTGKAVLVWRGECSFIEKAAAAQAAGQGLTLVHFSAQLEPCLSQENTLHTLNTLNTPLTGYTTPTRTPYPIQSAQIELKSGQVYAPAAGAAAVIVVSDEAELSPMSCAGNTSITIPVMQVLTEVGT